MTTPLTTNQPPPSPITLSPSPGERTLRYHPATAPAALPGSKMAASMCACAMCEGSGQQTCVNCLGEGSSYPDAFEWSRPGFLLEGEGPASQQHG